MVTLIPINERTVYIFLFLIIAVGVILAFNINTVQLTNLAEIKASKQRQIELQKTVNDTQRDTVNQTRILLNTQRVAGNVTLLYFEGLIKNISIIENENKALNLEMIQGQKQILSNLTKISNQIAKPR